MFWSQLFFVEAPVDDFAVVFVAVVVWSVAHVVVVAVVLFIGAAVVVEEVPVFVVTEAVIVVEVLYGIIEGAGDTTGEAFWP